MKENHSREENRKKMKRSLSKIYNTRSKKPRLMSPLGTLPVQRPQVVSASHVHNYMIKDPLVDWLRNKIRSGTRATPVYSSNQGFTDFIMKKGIEFESELVTHLTNTGKSIVKVSNVITDDSCRKAIELMKVGTPILHSVPVRNNYNRTQGIIDLLIRSDHIKDLVDENPLTPIEMLTPAPRLNSSYHYVVIDIKFSTLPLRSNSTHLLNSGHYPAYKAQTLIYTQAVGRIQGYTAPYAFILGRRWKYTSKHITHHSFNCLNRLGKIDFLGVDREFIGRTKQALKWVRDVRQNGVSWTVNPPCRPELYPNMCVDSGKWNVEKHKIAEKIGEVTSVWNVGVKHRSRALEAGVSSWRDSLCTSDLLGLRGSRGAVIDKIMAMNRQSKDLIWPKKIDNNLNGWKDKSNELYVDFETLSDIFADFNELPIQKRTNMIFMIGVGWESESGWEYRNFICTAPTPEEEYRVMDEFMSFMQEREEPRVHYWHAENRFWTAAENRQFDLACEAGDEDRKDRISDHWHNVEWCDMYDLFRSEPIVIKGCFKFGLKEIAAAMQKHKMITATIDSSCNSGMVAMVKAWECYRTASAPASSGTMLDIARYNEFDCKVLWEILSYLRDNHA